MKKRYFLIDFKTGDILFAATEEHTKAFRDKMRIENPKMYSRFKNEEYMMIMPDSGPLLKVPTESLIGSKLASEEIYSKLNKFDYTIQYHVVLKNGETIYE